MKNENKTFDGDKIYEISVTLFSGILTIGFVVTAVIKNIF